MSKQFKTELYQLKKRIQVDKKVFQLFLKRIRLGSLVKKQNPLDHFCSFFLPIDLNSRTIYLVHHRKADDWIPPGGHINQNESPLDTVKREFAEELNYILTDEKIELFDLTVKNISANPRTGCKIHYDFWFLVYLPKINFIYDRVEFYQAKWLNLQEAVKKMKFKDYVKVISKLNAKF